MPKVTVRGLPMMERPYQDETCGGGLPPTGAPPARVTDVLFVELLVQ